MNILAISLFLRHTTALFYKDSDQKTICDSDVIFKSSDIPSAISCAQKCFFLDKQLEVSFYQDVCNCIKRSDDGCLDDTDSKSVSGLHLKPVSWYFCIKDNCSLKICLLSWIGHFLQF